MAKKTISKDDYDAAWSIINYKNGYESGKAQGLSGYEKNHTDAQPHYDYLKKNNPELYNMLMTSDYNTAKNAMQNQYTMEYTPTQTASANNTFLVDKADEGFGIYNMMHTDPTYGQEIRDAFSAYGKSEGNQAAAGAAADNGGNFGSFADYNKKNTELAYKVAGENALQAKRDGYATGFSKIYTSVSDGLNDSSGQFLNYDYQTKKIEADERMNQDDNKTILAGYEYELEGIKDTNATNERMNQSDNDAAVKKAGSGSDTPKLNLNQALSAVKSGVVTQQVLDVINSNWKTNYTLDDNVWIDENDQFKTNKKFVADSDVESWVNKLNEGLKAKYGDKISYSAVNISEDGKYSVQPECVEYVSMEILKSDELDDSQKAYLLYDKFGISPETITNMLNDPHYN